MRTLCIDTSAGSAVAVCDAERVLAHDRSDDPRRHAETLAPLVAAALAEVGWGMGDLGAVVVGTGPAPYTGLRAGLVTARMLARGAGVAVHGVSGLDGLARQVLDLHPQATVLVATDARRREVYSARFVGRGDDDVERVTGPDVGAAAALGEDLAGLVADGAEVVVAGPGALLYPESLRATPGVPDVLDPAVYARIATARLAAGRETELADEPIYLRRPDVTMAAGPKRVS